MIVEQEAYQSIRETGVDKRRRCQCCGELKECPGHEAVCVDCWAEVIW